MIRGKTTGSVDEQEQPTWRKILLLLKQRGGMTTAELAKPLGLTSMGVRRQLSRLESDQLVAYETVQRGKGRPSYVYHLTAQAETLFPKNYAALTNELLGYLAQTDGAAAVESLFARRAQRRIADARAALQGLPLADQVARLAQILTDDGYLAEWRQSAPGTFLLSEHNCAIHDVAAEFRAACGSELIFLQAVLPDASVTRIYHLLSGQLMCAYRIERRKGAGHHA